MGLAPLRRTGGRTIASISGSERDSFRDASTSGIHRSFGARDLSQLHREFRGAGADLPEFGFGVPERACALRSELQLPTVSTLTLGDGYEKNDSAIAAVDVCGFCVCGIRSIDITIFGMD